MTARRGTTGGRKPAKERRTARAGGTAARWKSTGRGAMAGELMSARAPEPVGPYPHARRVGNLLFLSGIGPREKGGVEIPGVVRDASGKVIGHDIEAQCRAVFRNVRAVLEDAGSSWERIVDITVFLTDLQRDFPAYNRIYAEHFTGDRPTRTTVGVTCLPTSIAIELKVVATID